MLSPRIHCKLSALSQMLSQLHKSLISPQITPRKPFITPHPSPVSLQFRAFHSPNLALNQKSPPSASIQSHPPTFGHHGSRIPTYRAQKAFFDYLHFTRNLSFSDAEHISKNSPLFIQKLLSQIDDKDGVVRSLEKFLRYHPINEFEPFFESLGLPPDEVSAFVPQNLLFLNDDPLLIENYCALCNYGIPRVKIGKIFREAREIFGYESGSLCLKLAAYEKLGLSRGIVIQLVSCCPSLLIGDIDEDFVGVLERLTRLGIANDQIASVLPSRVSCDWKNVLDTMDFLCDSGYSNEQLSSLFKNNPQFLLEGSGKRIHVLFSQLHELGLNPDEVSSLFEKNPKLLSAKCAKNLLRSLDIFEYIGLETKETANLVCQHIEVLCLHPLKGGKTVCSELKIKMETLQEIVRENPSKFFTIASKNQVETMESVLSKGQRNTMDKTTFLLKLGYLENSDEIIRASKAFRGRAEELQERFDCLIEAGLDSKKASSLIKQVPMALNQTKDMLQKKIDCLKHCFPISSLVKFPAYLCYDVKRINSRFAMYEWLRDRGVVQPNLSVGTILASSEKKFMKYFVDVHPDGPAVWERLKSASS